MIIQDSNPTAKTVIFIFYFLNRQKLKTASVIRDIWQKSKIWAYKIAAGYKNKNLWKKK